LRGAAAKRISIVCRCEMRAVSFRELTSARFNSVRLRAHPRESATACTCWMRAYTCTILQASFCKLRIRWSANCGVVHRIDLLSGGNESTGRCIICRATHAKVAAQLSNARVRVHARVRVRARGITTARVRVTLASGNFKKLTYEREPVLRWFD